MDAVDCTEDDEFKKLAAAYEHAEAKRDQLIQSRTPARQIDQAWSEVGAAARACHDHLAERAPVLEGWQ